MTSSFLKRNYNSVENEDTIQNPEMLHSKEFTAKKDLSFNSRTSPSTTSGSPHSDRFDLTKSTPISKLDVGFMKLTAKNIEIQYSKTKSTINSASTCYNEINSGGVRKYSHGEKHESHFAHQPDNTGDDEVLPEDKAFYVMQRGVKPKLFSQLSQRF